MKIVTWNCNGALRKKYTRLAKYNADIFVIQECEDPNIVALKSGGFHKFAANHIWVGSNKNKGLGIFAKNDVSMEKLNWNHNFRGRKLQWFLPVEINNKFNLLSVWNHHADAKAFAYIGQFWLFMKNNKKLFKKSVICGDFNSNSRWDHWDRWWNHSDCVKELSKINIFSAYHQLNNINHGSEKQNTFYLHKDENKGYHIDYIFADKRYLNKRTSCLKFGKYSKWKDVSDHVPLIFDF